jgi:polysaccharide biosynthesis transport protein
MSIEQELQNASMGGASAPPTQAIGEAASATPPRKSGFSVGGMVRTLKRNVLLVAGLPVLTTAGSAYMSMQSPQVYQGQFRIQVEPITSQGRAIDPSVISARAAAQGGGPDGNSVDYPTLLQVLQSSELLSKIASQIRTRYPNVTETSLSEDIKRKRLTVERVGTTLIDSARLIDVSYKGSDPQRVKFILEQLRQGFLRFSLEDRRNRIGGGVEFIEDQLPGLQQRVNTLASKVQGLQQQYRLTDPKLESDAIAKQLQDTQLARLATQRDLAEQQSLFNKLQQQVGMSTEEALAAASLSGNTRYQEMIGELKKLETAIALKRARFEDASPVLKSLLEQRDNLVGLMNQEAARNLGESFAGVANSERVRAFQSPLHLDLIKQMVTASNSIQQLQIRNQAVSQGEAFLGQRIREFPAIMRQYSDLQQQLDMSQKTLNQFLVQRESLRIEAAQKEIPWEIVAEPSLMKDLRGNPKPAESGGMKQIGMGLFAGLGLGVGLAFLKEKRRNIFYTSEDIAPAVRPPVLGTIPSFSSLGSLGQSFPSVEQDKSLAAGFKDLYTNLRFLRQQDPIRSFVITSAAGKDGRSTVASNLAMTAAAMGQKVLLVDLNLNHPQLHEGLKLSNQVGLTDLLASPTASLESVLQQDHQEPNLSVLTAGQLATPPERVFASTELSKLMEKAKSMFDLVIYDTPSLKETPDTQFLISNTDGVLMVVGVMATKRGALKQVLNDLQKFKLPVLGVVANHPARLRSKSSPNRPSRSDEKQAEPSLLMSNLGLMPATPPSAK